MTGLDWTGHDLLVGIRTVYIMRVAFLSQPRPRPHWGRRLSSKYKGEKKNKSSNDLSLCQQAIEWKKPLRNPFVPWTNTNIDR